MNEFYVCHTLSISIVLGVNVIKLIEIVILRVFYTMIPFGFSLFSHFSGITFQLFKLLCLTKDH